LQAMWATDTRCQGMSDRPCEFVPDTYSFLICLDNHATCCMENDVHNFVTKLTPTPNIRLMGVGNQLMTAKGRGTVLWKIEDDNRVVHEKLFPRTLYIPDLKLFLFSPHLWCQLADDHFPRRDGTWQYQTADSFVMEWDQRNFCRTVPWDRRTNNGCIISAPGTKHYRVFADVHDQQQEFRKHEHVAYPAHVIPDDRTEASGERNQTQSTAGDENTPLFPTVNKEDGENLADFFKESQGPTIILDDDSERLAAASPQADLLR
jgi:hypothetical protein